MSEEMERLSPQELVVIKGWAEGKLDKQIAVEMNLSIHTVRSYGTAIRSKLSDSTPTVSVSLNASTQLSLGLGRSKSADVRRPMTRGPQPRRRWCASRPNTRKRTSPYASANTSPFAPSPTFRHISLADEFRESAFRFTRYSVPCCSLPSSDSSEACDLRRSR